MTLHGYRLLNNVKDAVDNQTNTTALIRRDHHLDGTGKCVRYTPKSLRRANQRHDLAAILDDFLTTGLLNLGERKLLQSSNLRQRYRHALILTPAAQQECLTVLRCLLCQCTLLGRHSVVNLRHDPRTLGNTRDIKDQNNFTVTRDRRSSKN